MKPYREALNAHLTQVAMKQAQEWAERFAESRGMGVDDGPALVLTDEQAEREYGTPDQDGEPWLLQSLREGI